jgi:hypothetical protein
MNLLDIFSKSVSNVINDEVYGITSKLNSKIDNAINDVFSKGLKKVGIGGKLGRALESEFASSLQNARADKFFGKVTSVSERASPADICNAMTPKFAETAFDAAKRLKGQNEGANDSKVFQFPQQQMAYYTKLEFNKYVRPTPQNAPTLELKHTVILPIPKDLEESLNVRLSQDDAGMAQGITNALLNISKGEDPQQEISNTIRQAAVKKLNDLTKGQLGQVGGAIPNPYVTLMFNGVDLRTFTFTWKFAPRNDTESKMLKAIIQLIKGSALPTYSSSPGVLQYPLMCKMTLMAQDGSWNPNSALEGGGKFQEGSHPIIGFKNALIENVTINHSPNGIPSFFAGTSLPTFYQVSITLKEIEYFTAEDYGRDPGTDIFKELLDPIINAVENTDAAKAAAAGIKSIFPAPK